MFLKNKKLIFIIATLVVAGTALLKSIWKDLSPKNNVDLMGNKNIFIAISKSDKLIPYRLGKEFTDLMKNLYPQNTTIKENNHLGHYLTAAKYYLFDNELLK